MTVTVCFDALGTSFSLDPVVKALDELLGDELRQAGSCPRMTIMDWFHSAQRDYTYRSITSPPPPPISQFLTLSLPRALTVALSRTPSHSPTHPLPDLNPVTSKLANLTPQPGLGECYNILKNEAHANIIIITNGTRSTTEGYVRQAGLEDYVDSVRSCDEVGLAKPFPEVYGKAHDACVEVEVKNGNRHGSGQEREDRGRWFVAAHLWDLAAARKAGFKTAYVLAEQPPLGKKDGKDEMKEWYDLYGGEPDIIGADLAEVARKITEASK